MNVLRQKQLRGSEIHRIQTLLKRSPETIYDICIGESNILLDQLDNERLVVMMVAERAEHHSKCRQIIHFCLRQFQTQSWVSATSKSGYNLLTFCAKHGLLNCLRFAFNALDNDHSWLLRERQGAPNCMHSASQGNQECVIRWISERVSRQTVVKLLCQRHRGLTPFLWACHLGHTESAKALMLLGASITALSNKRQGAVHFAVQSGNRSCAELVAAHILQRKARHWLAKSRAETERAAACVIQSWYRNQKLFAQAAAIAELHRRAATAYVELDQLLTRVATKGDVQAAADCWRRLQTATTPDAFSMALFDWRRDGKPSILGRLLRDEHTLAHSIMVADRDDWKNRIGKYLWSNFCRDFRATSSELMKSVELSASYGADSFTDRAGLGAAAAVLYGSRLSNESKPMELISCLRFSIEGYLPCLAMCFSKWKPVEALAAVKGIVPNELLSRMSLLLLACVCGPLHAMDPVSATTRLGRWVQALTPSCFLEKYRADELFITFAMDQYHEDTCIYLLNSMRTIPVQAGVLIADPLLKSNKIQAFKCLLKRLSTYLKEAVTRNEYQAIMTGAKIGNDVTKSFNATTSSATTAAEVDQWVALAKDLPIQLSPSKLLALLELHPTLSTLHKYVTDGWLSRGTINRCIDHTAQYTIKLESAVKLSAIELQVMSLLPDSLVIVRLDQHDGSLLQLMQKLLSTFDSMVIDPAQIVAGMLADLDLDTEIPKSRRAGISSSRVGQIMNKLLAEVPSVTLMSTVESQWGHLFASSISDPVGSASAFDAFLKVFDNKQRSGLFADNEQLTVFIKARLSDVVMSGSPFFGLVGHLHALSQIPRLAERIAGLKDPNLDATVHKIVDGLYSSSVHPASLAVLRALVARVCPMALQCGICFEDTELIRVQAPNRGGEHYDKLQCNHRYCKDCLSGWVESNIQSRCLTIRCPDTSCSVALLVEDIQQHASEAMLKLYKQRIKELHAVNLRAIERGDTSTFNWIRRHCRQCPRCQAPIERSQGCDQMMCVCGHRFQWTGPR
eukprot:TRINITY_DN11048_c0_g1_i2.p1 TRINITY_DN11048_c0_g1~~TRINITY_DN11048_c0_g1_i2.p1  ORF type:complete len:1022 (+),score=105.83 TRINITY_DN11048_c0_g1_i2:87-3152(+)